MTSRERAEKEADAQLDAWSTDVHGLLRTAIRNDLMVPAIQRAIDDAVAEEREECAKVAEDLLHVWAQPIKADAVSKAIRLRGAK